jgi:hypothetical protein
MLVPGLGEVTVDEGFGWYRSQLLRVEALERECQFVLEGYDEDDAKTDFHAAIANILELHLSVLQASSPEIFRYYQDCKATWGATDHTFPVIPSAREVWKHIQLGRELMVCRRNCGDKGVYISIECECDWEPEHGLQVVLKHGAKVTKVGPYDGHLTNADAAAKPDLENVIYAGA